MQQSTLKPLHKMELTDQHPLFCKNNQLFIAGNVELRKPPITGDVLTFTDNAKNIKVSYIDANDRPAPLTRRRKTIQ